MSGFVKLFQSILDSTIWLEKPEVKVVWVTMLLKANRDGVVEASVPGLAHSAGVTLSACKEALTLLSSPDEFSRTEDNNGIRIKKVDGGWLLLNHSKYRADTSTDRVREWRKKQRETDETNETFHSVSQQRETDETPPDPDPDPDISLSRDKNGQEELSKSNTNRQDIEVEIDFENVPAKYHQALLLIGDLARRHYQPLLGPELALRLTNAYLDPQKVDAYAILQQARTDIEIGGYDVNSWQDVSRILNGKLRNLSQQRAYQRQPDKAQPSKPAVNHMRQVELAIERGLAIEPDLLCKAWNVRGDAPQSVHDLVFSAMEAGWVEQEKNGFIHPSGFYTRAETAETLSETPGETVPFDMGALMSHVSLPGNTEYRRQLETMADEIRQNTQPATYPEIDDSDPEMQLLAAARDRAKQRRN